MAIIAFYNLKGGVGKTASSVNIAYLAAANGYKTLLWDIDPQGAASYYYNIEPATKNGSKKLLTEEVILSEAAIASDFINLSVVPADISARNADIIFSETKQYKKKFKTLLQNAQKHFDVIIIDCPPGISLLHDALFAAVDWVLMPNIPTTLSIKSFEKVCEYFEANELSTAKIKCFFSMVDHRKNLHHEVMNEFYKQKIFFKNYLPYLSDIEKMGVNQQPVFEFANSSYAAQCYRDVFAEIKKHCL